MQQAIDYINKKIEKYSKVVSDMDKKYIWNEIKYTYHGWFDHGYAKWKLTALEDMKDEVQALWDGWIPVTERLPEEDEETELILANKGRWMVFSWFYDENWFYTIDWEDDREHKSERFVDYWMPLPLPPK